MTCLRPNGCLDPYTVVFVIFKVRRPSEFAQPSQQSSVWASDCTCITKQPRLPNHSPKMVYPLEHATSDDQTCLGNGPESALNEIGNGLQAVLDADVALSLPSSSCPFLKLLFPPLLFSFARFSYSLAFSFLATPTSKPPDSNI